MHDIAGRLDRELKAAGVAIIGVSIGNATDTDTWLVQPSIRQGEAQPFIDAIDLDAWELDEHFEDLRGERNQRLANSDWTQLSDVSVDVDEWRLYRQALRDLPANTVDPENPIWPSAPEL